MVNKRELFQKYSDQDFIGFSVQMRTDTTTNSIVSDDKPWELYFNKKEFSFDKKEYFKGDADRSVNLMFVVIKDIVDSISPIESKKFNPIDRPCCSECKFFSENTHNCTNSQSHYFASKVDPNKGCRRGIKGSSSESLEIRFNPDDARAVEFVKDFPNAKPYNT